MAKLARAMRSIVMFAAVASAATLSGFVAAAPASPLSVRAATAITGEEHKGASPPVARYAMDDGGEFVLDRTNAQPLLRFEGDPEIWLLLPSAAPRGDTIYRNEVGLEVLRATRMGGMTVFTDRRPEGSAASLEGPGLPLRLPALSPTALFQRVYYASVRASRAAQHNVAFVSDDSDATSSGIVADSALVASEAIISMAAHPAGKLFLSRISSVVIVMGSNPAVSVKGGAIIIAVNPSMGIAGRPSSLRVQRATGVRMTGNR